jgi:four helix bundle protein
MAHLVPAAWCVTPEALRRRTFEFAVANVRYCRKLAAEWTTRELARQLLRAATSVAANYRAACRGRSRREFIAKLGIAVEEADESVFWLELLAGTGMGTGGDQVMLRREAEELLKILARSYRTARGNSEGGG